MTASEAEMHMTIVEMRAGVTLEASALLLTLAEACLIDYGLRSNALRLTPRPAADPTSSAGLYNGPPSSARGIRLATERVPASPWRLKKTTK